VSSHSTWIALRACLLSLAVLLTGCSGVPGPDGPDDTLGVDFAIPDPASAAADGAAIVFVVDGVNARLFQEMLEAGQLPAIEKHLARRGLYAPRAVTGIPSVTLANLTGIATGLLPGRHGITGVRFFDPVSLVWRNYATIAQKNTVDDDYHATTLFEHLGDRNTFAIFFQPHRGATRWVENRYVGGAAFFLGYYRYIDRLTLSRFGMVAEAARRHRRFPALTIAYLLAPDFHAYGYGVHSLEYRQALRHTDRQIGRVLGDLDRAGLLDKLVIAFVADHGMGSVTRHFVLRDFLEDDLGLVLADGEVWDNEPFEDRLAYYARHTAVLATCGDRYAAITLRKPRPGTAGKPAFAPWAVRPDPADLRAWPVRTPERRTVDLLDALAGHQAVDAVAYRAGRGRARVRTAAGEVEFARTDDTTGAISYRVLSGRDPLGWAGRVPRPLLAGEPADGRTWLKATCRTDMPDLPEQILTYFRSRRAGDIAVFAAPGWDFENTNRAGHGGLRADDDMCVPLLIAGPGVPHGRLETVRAVDLVPTLLDLLGRPVPAGLDGKSLAPPPPGPGTANEP